MAAAAPISHSRESSMAGLDRDVNTRFSFPTQPQERPLSNFQFPPTYITTSETFAFPPRRGSVPLMGSLKVPVNHSRPRSSQEDALKALVNSKATEKTPTTNAPGYVTAGPRPNGPGARSIGRTVGDGVTPTILNASVRMGPSNSNHNREASELLQVPTLETQHDEPIQKRAPPPPGVNIRRGHAHRRSGAISSSDVWSLMKEKAPPIPGTHLEPGNTDASRLSPRSSPRGSPMLSPSTPASPMMNASTEPLLSVPDNTNPEELNLNSERRHSRVCFTEDVEVIPQPPSAGTESSSTKTVKSHNVSGSLSSSATVSVSPNTESGPSPTRRQNRTRSNSQTLAMPTAALRAQTDRPKTAGASLSSIQFSVDQLPPTEVPTLKRDAASAVSPNPNSESSSPIKPSKKKSHKKAKSEFSPLMMSGEFGLDDKDKKKKGKKQIKDWAGNILGKGKLKHSKKRKSKSKRAPTPPPVSKSAEHLSPVGGNEWVATSWNESYVMMPVDVSPVVDDHKVTVAGGIGSPVIDLDAALGPFKTPVEHHTGFAAARRRMHSAASRGGNFHRRSESMPEMQLFALEEDEDRTMEDVFEEEEETTSEEESSSDEEEEEGQIDGGDGLGIEIQEAAQQMDEWPRKRESVHHVTAASKRLSSATITAVTVSTAVSDDAQRPSTRSKRPCDIMTPTSPTVSAEDSLSPPFSVPSLDSPLTFVTASSGPGTPIQNDFTSDDCSGTFDPYRDYLGEPGPEMRLSVDDIPSLTSSRSTMTMNAAYLGMPSTPGSTDSTKPPSSKDKKTGMKRWSKVWAFWRK